MRREITAKWSRVHEKAMASVTARRVWDHMLASVQLSGLVKEEAVAECKARLVAGLTQQPDFFELFLHHAVVRVVQKDERSKGGAAYSLELPRDEWLHCCSVLGVLPAAPTGTEGAGELEAWKAARHALLGIFNSVNKRREQMVTSAKLDHFMKGERGWASVDMARDGMSGSSAGLSLSEFIECIIFTACDAADGTVDGRWAEHVQSTYTRSQKGKGKRSGGLQYESLGQMEHAHLSVDEVNAAMDHFTATWMLPLERAHRTFRAAVQSSRGLSEILEGAAPLHAAQYTSFATRDPQIGVVRMTMRGFRGLIAAKWGGDDRPGEEQVSAAYAQAMHIDLYITSPHKSKQLAPHAFQAALLWLALSSTRRDDATPLNRAPLPPTAASMVAEVEELPSAQRAKRLEAIRKCLALGDPGSGAVGSGASEGQAGTPASCGQMTASASRTSAKRGRATGSTSRRLSAPREAAAGPGGSTSELLSA